MTTILLSLMALLLIAALERNNRRQSGAWPHSLTGSLDRDDRDWARIKLDLTALGEARQGPNDGHHIGPRAA